MKISKTTFNAIIFDILNWTFNISVVVFLWKLDHFWAMFLTGLWLFKYVAHFLYLRSKYNEEHKIIQEKLADVEKLFSKIVDKSEASQFEFLDKDDPVPLDDEEILEEGEQSPSTPPKKDYIQ